MTAVAIGFAVALGIDGASVTPRAQGPSLKSQAGVFVEELQRAVARDDRGAVAALIRYPITAAAILPIPIKDATGLVDVYDAIFAPELRIAIALSGLDNGTVSEPAYPVTVDGEQIVLAGGLLTAELTSKGYRITHIVVPRSSSWGRQGPRRVLFRAGRRTAEFSGALGRFGVQTYVVYAQAGQILQVGIQGIRGRNVVVRILRAATGRPVDARTAQGTRTWIGAIPATGDYQIQVVRLVQDGAAALLYRLMVTLRQAKTATAINPGPLPAPVGQNGRSAGIAPRARHRSASRGE